MERDERLIYLDCAATTPLVDEVRAAMAPWLGEEWNEGYENAYGARTAVSKKAGQVIVDFARLMRDHPDGFEDKLERVLDVDEFLRYLAVTVLIGNGDSPVSMCPHT